ncbi:hypothetical protein AQ610_25605 [Burkholderia humptydooensis]|uniref:Uncharacterized protein n=1 Tax=Burkholderia humptydooensis MSMB43 TaxID=441157 RepID=A0ABN0G3P8_9BURK|nr:hypothetical protein AQ610_25605 [Burkholderia humptydooensis]EIP86784.1 hypothetical protein A33K_16387 [Burkholderia humptydooensis MSMB43]
MPYVRGLTGDGMWAVVVVMRMVRSAARGGATGNGRIVAKNGRAWGAAWAGGAAAASSGGRERSGIAADAQERSTSAGTPMPRHSVFQHVKSPRTRLSL